MQEGAIKFNKEGFLKDLLGSHAAASEPWLFEVGGMGVWRLRLGLGLGLCVWGVGVQTRCR